MSVSRAIVAVVLLAGCRGEDARIEREIEQRLEAEGHREVQVDVFHGAVSLTGRVDSFEARNRVDAIASSVQRVRGVDNELVVPLPPLDPNELARLVRARLVSEGFTAVLVSATSDGVVTLRGTVDRERRDTAVRVAREASPQVRRVDDSLKLR